MTHSFATGVRSPEPEILLSFRVASCLLLASFALACNGGERRSGIPGGPENAATFGSSAEDPDAPPLCLKAIDGPNHIACTQLPAGCGEASLRCRPQSGLCLPDEDDATVSGCRLNQGDSTPPCSEGFVCAAGLCIPAATRWSAPHKCESDEDCWSYNAEGRPERDGTWCNLEAGGYCLAECSPGTTCPNGTACTCDGRCKPAENKVALYAPSLEIPAGVVSFGQAPIEGDYSPKAVAISVSVDNRAFGSDREFGPEKFV